MRSKPLIQLFRTGNSQSPTQDAAPNLICWDGKTVFKQALTVYMVEKKEQYAWERSRPLHPIGLESPMVSQQHRLLSRKEARQP
jgi:hypothetical protein